ncbi:peptidoglycan-binding domain-containing protein [Candidatus Sororendozoicomonas aggregata]|uniref:peptidoglycan-binding domain-containing protein n=1 Tax=Candidatus Sororendozoicomonas aggregata TaxID=3073239 RepID=UPI002ED6A27A
MFALILYLLVLYYSHFFMLLFHQGSPMLNKELLVKKHYLEELKPLGQTFVQGDQSPEVKKIKEWLMLWELIDNDVSQAIELNEVFDEQATILVKATQKFLNLPVTGEVDAKTWSEFLMPLRNAFDLDVPQTMDLRQRMRYFASRHLQYHAAELLEDNIGPWVRSYMIGGYDGTRAYWCQAFASTILDQAFSSFDKCFTDYYINTDACEYLRRDARKHGLLYDHQALKSGEYVPQIGDIVLYLIGDKNEAHHTEILYEVLDQQSGKMRTIGGNTNFVGSRNGVGVFLVDRNFLAQNVEIVKLVDI